MISLINIRNFSLGTGVIATFGLYFSGAFVIIIEIIRELYIFFISN
jgi:hypothetical protein